jgi:hypothetical protein
METLVEFFVFMSACFFAVVIVNTILAYFSLKTVATKVRTHLRKIVHEVKIEKDDSMEYWYDSETDEFLAQGITIEGVIEHLKSRFPGHVFIVPKRGIISAPHWKLNEHFLMSEWQETTGV